MLRFTDFLTQQSQVNIPVNQAKTKLFFKNDKQDCCTLLRSQQAGLGYVSTVTEAE